MRLSGPLTASSQDLKGLRLFFPPNAQSTEACGHVPAILPAAKWDKILLPSKPNHTSEFTMEALVSACFPERVKPNQGRGPVLQRLRAVQGGSSTRLHQRQQPRDMGHTLSPPSGPQPGRCDSVCPSSSRCRQFHREQSHSIHGRARGSFSSLPARPWHGTFCTEKILDRCLRADFMCQRNSPGDSQYEHVHLDPGLFTKDQENKIKLWIKC